MPSLREEMDTEKDTQHISEVLNELGRRGGGKAEAEGRGQGVESADRHLLS